MGLLKRLFSIGSKKNKKQRPPIVHDVPLPEPTWGTEIRPVVDEEHEAAASRLLRSSSARYVENPGLDYANLPPLPHPINTVIQTPASSAVSLDSTSLSHRGTYNVTVHGRKKHPSMDFADARQPSNIQPTAAAQRKKNRTSLHAVEDSRVLRLRSDPSVASLVSLYDEHGKLAADVFSNSPPSTPKARKEEHDDSRDGRAQVRRNGSTLRQLLGASASLSSRDGNESGSAEGDISWAERFLAETEATSSTSSLVLQTPTTPFHSQLPEPEISFATEGSFSNTTFDNPAISSMEVELSIDISNDIEDLDSQGKANGPYLNGNPSTPQRASQVFGFLTKAKQSTVPEDLDRPLPEPPSCFSTPSDENARHENPTTHATPLPALFHFQVPVTTMSASDIDRTPRSHRSRSLRDIIPSKQEPRSAFSEDSHEFRSSSQTNDTKDHDAFDDRQEENKNKIKVIMNGPTKVIVTAPTPSTNHTGPSRLLRGPRALPRRSSNSSQRRRSALVEVSNSTPPSVVDYAKVNPSGRKVQSLKRSNSQSSNRSSCGSFEQGPEYVSRPKKLESCSASARKENQLKLSVKTELPSTPLRSHSTSSHALLRTVVQQAMFHPPSPASSSEMSPVGRQMMTDVRQQRMQAREAERKQFASRYGRSQKI